MPELNREETSLVYRLYLSKEKLKYVTKEDLQVFFHILRMANSLRSIMKLQVKIKETDRLETFKDRMELYLLNIATYYEALKTLIKTLMPRISKEYLSTANLKAISKLQERFENRKNDAFIRVAMATRNKIVFHFDSKVVDDFVRDGSPSKDILIGYARSTAIADSVLLEPSTAIIKFLSDQCPKYIDKKDAIDWIESTSIHEISEFCKTLERLAGAFFKKNGKLVKGPPLL